MGFKQGTLRFWTQPFIFVLGLAMMPAIGTAQDCADSIGKMVSVQGEVDIRRSNQTSWKSIKLDEDVCPGDMLRSGKDSRAAVFLINESVLRINQNSTLSFPQQQPDQPFLLRIINGMMHIFSHRPRALKVVTPFVNGAVEGTEFLAQVDENKTLISVFKGLVVALNEQGRLDVSSGQAVVAEKSAAPKYQIVVKPRDAVQWTLYYPEIIGSLKEKSKVSSYIRKAADQLAVGQVKEAQANIEKVLAQEPDNSDALALEAIIFITQNDKEKALDLARRAVQFDPRSAAASIALSYALQAGFDIRGALDVLLEAASLHPNNSLIQARLSELWLSVGELEKSLKAAQEAVALNPNIGRTQTVLGFAYLAQIKTDQARDAFEHAIVLDQALPLARLGLGLAKIRDGDLEEGRADIEIAAALDPDNSLIRSYLGKSFYEEKRDKRAQEQYSLAKQLDPMDPTPWLYDAILKQSENRPVEALHDLQKSIELNDNRAVYRSKLLLDEDLAVRSASLGRIYNDLGFQQLALVEGWKSVNTDPANFSAHRLLADTYGALPRHEIARVSELLQSQLLQPLNINPVQPQLSEGYLAILDGAGPAETSFSEFNPLFLRNKLVLQASGVIGDNQTLGDEVTQSGVWNNISYSLGQFHYETDGVRENNDQNLNVYNAFLQTQLSYKASLLAELRYRKRTYGDLNQKFDPTDYSPTIRQNDKEISFRVGSRYAFNRNSNLIGTIIYSDSDSTAGSIPFFDNGLIKIEGDTEGYMGEIQYIYGGNRFNLTSGLGYLTADRNDALHLEKPFLTLSDKESSTTHFNLYSYANLDIPYDVTITAGLSADFPDNPMTQDNQLNPKLGIVWQVFKDTTLRGAVFRTFQRRLIYAQTIEPTQVSGFNQLFGDFEASEAWLYGIGLDQKLLGSCFGGFRYTTRELEVPFSHVVSAVERAEDDWNEQLGKIYFYWPITTLLTFGTEYYYEKLKHDRYEGPQGIQELSTHRVVPNVAFFHPSGFTANVQASYIDQEGTFGSYLAGYRKERDSFWVFDASLSYRLPKRRGILRLEIKNLFNEQFNYLDSDISYLDTNVTTLNISPERQVVGSFTLSF